jgi:hypothetical protein
LLFCIVKQSEGVRGARNYKLEKEFRHSAGNQAAENPASNFRTKVMLWGWGCSAKIVNGKVSRWAANFGSDAWGGNGF